MFENLVCPDCKRIGCYTVAEDDPQWIVCKCGGERENPNYKEDENGN